MTAFVFTFIVDVLIPINAQIIITYP